jgi:hypothetical protein
MGASEQSFYRWKKKYAGLGVSERQAEEAGCRLDARQAHSAGGAGKKVVKPAGKRSVARCAEQAFQLSERRACRLVSLDRSSCRDLLGPRLLLRLRQTLHLSFGLFFL